MSVYQGDYISPIFICLQCYFWHISFIYNLGNHCWLYTCIVHVKNGGILQILLQFSLWKNLMWGNYS